MASASSSASKSQDTAAGTNGKAPAGSSRSRDRQGRSLGPTEVLLNTPPQVIHLLTYGQPFLHALTTLAQVLTWSHPNFFVPFLGLFVWWLICLYGELAVRYGFNAGLLALMAWGWVHRASHRPGGLAKRMEKGIEGGAEDDDEESDARVHPSSGVYQMSPSQFATSLYEVQILSDSIGDFLLSVQPVIYPFSWRSVRASYRLMSFLFTSYPFYIILTHFCPLRYIYLALGTTVLLWNAPWFAVIRRAVWASAAFRFLIRFAYGILSGGRGLRREWSRGHRGIGLIGRLFKASVQPQVGWRYHPTEAEKLADSTGASSADKTKSDVHFLFTIYENQRWWVGLDWTHALLPNERPSWSDAHDAAVSPPASFMLPAPTVSYVASPTRQDPESHLKHTVEWKWLDPEWTIKAASKHAASSSVESAPSSGWRSVLRRGSDAKAGQQDSAASTLKAAIPGKASDPDSIKKNDEADKDAEEAAHQHPIGAHVEDHQAHWDVDHQGWQYGDNAWAKLSSDAGMGRYTRRRAWVRRAIAVHSVERVSRPKAASSASKRAIKDESSAPGDDLAQNEGDTRARRRSSGASGLKRRSVIAKVTDGQPSSIAEEGSAIQ
ncbi:uncharacterized protein L969DRAFT_48177 [Mixia osmundae IAM 14324]|uniref:Peroxin/Ferlin domain-containing protein n=1 Tax=Mixia osmundae (strain CBS 9802 / IAM 14324 / JCM 22182 / KY 12970) TaxID=764103 RepID=G7E9L2_MIXOS|nr:uncharacterized protein L969DRAFT_48177 [Mixia osmundae IAM 14324]KEI39962.1 hypothetical protein L969DRAFT_48177 [Mixia osmundae IAM 14324]GAA99331.1 hypothetical protein E5Q_06026 [Mixia osmundae IAM 14324]